FVVVGDAVDVLPPAPELLPFGVQIPEHQSAVRNDRDVPARGLERASDETRRRAESEIYERIGLDGTRALHKRRRVVDQRRDRHAAREIEPVRRARRPKTLGESASDRRGLKENGRRPESPFRQPAGEDGRLLLERADLVVERELAAGSLASRPVDARQLERVRERLHDEAVVRHRGSEHKQAPFFFELVEGGDDLVLAADRQSARQDAAKLERAIDAPTLGDVVDPESHRALEALPTVNGRKVVQHTDEDGCRLWRCVFAHPYKPVRVYCTTCRICSAVSVPRHAGMPPSLMPFVTTAISSATF